MQTKTDQLIYLYALIPTAEFNNAEPSEEPGIDPDEKLSYHEIGPVTAVICPVSSSEFSEDELKKNAENMEWLQEKAFHHHETMNRLNRDFTVIPLKFGTIYETTESLEQALHTKHERLKELFTSLAGKEEWNVKVYADRDTFHQTVLETSPAIEEKNREIENMSKGKQFFERRKLDQFVSEQADREINEKCEALHDRLTGMSSDQEIKKNWDRKVTGRTESMCFNSAYLLDTENAGTLIDAVEAANKAPENAGLTFELTGPWPAYHFSSLE
ncbi:GvpL/GvpF family gas vesicle protein [Alteribacter natronophilus]|uniref:GvpL/GvpF family gas vesicle protein n=1 Tax=Alteribacter natronophilus TaxID=2583810 RepID=UPI00110D73D6|nr:GvpL/GvpF family gas vesicle protein [Alteribacter natronophilus]TMW72219.1 GvpL/GvpF family gas vesicle protein [Alteribacter natronophilus]